MWENEVFIEWTVNWIWRNTPSSITSFSSEMSSFLCSWAAGRFQIIEKLSVVKTYRIKRETDILIWKASAEWVTMTKKNPLKKKIRIWFCLTISHNDLTVNLKRKTNKQVSSCLFLLFLALLPSLPLLRARVSPATLLGPSL